MRTRTLMLTGLAGHEPHQQPTKVDVQIDGFGVSIDFRQPAGNGNPRLNLDLEQFALLAHVVAQEQAAAAGPTPQHVRTH